jgi:hypothetical protein
MKKLFIPILVGISTMTLLAGCAWEVGGGSKHTTIQPSVGQQLIDLQKAKDAGAITDSEYQAQKEMLLGAK